MSFLFVIRIKVLIDVFMHAVVRRQEMRLFTRMTGISMALLPCLRRKRQLKLHVIIRKISMQHINSYTTTSMLCTLIYFENGTCPSTYII
jgi:hypothetical protein